MESQPNGDWADGDCRAGGVGLLRATGVFGAMTLALAALGTTSIATAQTAPLQWEDVPVRIDSRMIDAPGVRGDGAQLVFSQDVGINEADWVRLEFGDVELSGSPRDGDGAFLRITSLLDGAQQTLDAVTIRQWRHTTAYFNGRFVRVELFAYPEAGPSRVQIVNVQAGVPQGDMARSICGDSDQRQLSGALPNEPDGRVMPVGCTSFLIGDRCFLTAGHCTANSGTFNPNLMQVIQFNVPLSNSNGSVNHPGPEDQYPVDTSSIQFQDAGCGNDWAYFGTFNNSETGLTPFAAQGTMYTPASSAPSPSNQTIRIRGYGTTTGTDAPNTWSQVLTWHNGPYIGLHSGTLIEHQADTTGGNSGSAIYLFGTASVIGVHTCAGCGSNWPNWDGNRGTAIHHVNLQNALANPQGVCVGSCCEANGTPGCDDATCQNLICDADPFCCNTEWDSICANAANQQCHTCFECGHGPAGDCCEANGSPYCDDAACCEMICANDPYCCNTNWDSICANAANQQCHTCFECGHSAAGNCCESNGSPYCDDAACCDMICADDPYCCNTNWDGICANAANQQCIDTCFECGHGPAGNCCEVNGTPYCDDADCCEMICASDPYCCNTNWDSICANSANQQCNTCLECGHSAAGDCCEANGSPYCDDESCCQAVCNVDPYCCDVTWDGVCAATAADACPACQSHTCLGDLNDDGVVDVSDLLTLLGVWGSCGDPANCPADLNNDGVVDVSDLLILLGAWGPCPAAVCDTGFTCGGDPVEQCPGDDPDCYCFTGFNGDVVCAIGISCSAAPLCNDGNCPPGYVCLVDTCCFSGDPVCAPICGSTSASEYAGDSGEATLTRPAMR